MKRVLILFSVLLTLFLPLVLAEAPQFSSEIIDDDQDCYADDCIGPGVNIYFYINVTNTNGTVFLEIDGQNLSAVNQGLNVYAVGYNFCNPGNHEHKWHAYGTSPDYTLDNSSTFSVNVIDNFGIVPPFCDSEVPPAFLPSMPLFFNRPSDNQESFDGAGLATFEVEISRTNGTAFLEIDNQNISATNSSDIFSTSHFLTKPGNYSYTWFAYKNDTLGLYQSTQDFYYDIPFFIFSSKILGVSSISFPTSANISVNITDLNNSDCNYGLYKNNLLLPTLNDSNILAAGTYLYKLNSSSCDFYTANSSVDTFVLTIAKADSKLNFTLNQTFKNITLLEGTSINISCNQLFGDSQTNVHLYVNDTLKNSSVNLLFNSAGIHNITCIYNASQNYTLSKLTLFVNVTKIISEPVSSFHVFNDNSNTLTDKGFATFNVTVNNTNGSVFLEINHLNITANNVSNIYYANYTFTTSGTFTYVWHSFSNDSNQTLISSESKPYVVKKTPPKDPPEEKTKSSRSGTFPTRVIPPLIPPNGHNYSEKIVSLISSVPKIITVKNLSGFPVSKVKLTSNKNLPQMKIEFIRLDAKPRGVSSKKFISEYFEIKLSETSYDKFDEIILSLKVLKNNSAGINMTNAIASRWVDNAWIEFPMVYSYGDSHYYYYTVQVPGFSFWVISKNTSISTTSPLNSQTNSSEFVRSNNTNSNPDLFFEEHEDPYKIPHAKFIGITLIGLIVVGILLAGVHSKRN